MKRAFCVLAALMNEQKHSVIGKMKPLTNFKEWKFRDPPNYAALPIDENPEYNVPMAVKDAVFSKVPTEPLTGKLHLVCASDPALIDLLDLDPSVADTEDFINFVAGAYLPEGGLTVSHRYGGYQFGFWADQLGDGRAHILGEYVNSKGESWQPQLKGSGETPYSRFGDGRAVLRSSIREMIASEACHYLGVPTTRAAALVVSDDHKVWRDKTYSGRSRQERAATVMRLANAWYRIGSLEILLKRKEPHTLKLLADFIIDNHFPEVASSGEDKYVKWYSEVAHKNLDMVATWQGLGFVHGVLNTDNVSLLGLTIDYGPYGFIDHYYEHYVPNTSDDMGRYAYNKQPEILVWNLGKLAEAMEPILSDAQKQEIKDIHATLDDYVKTKVLKTYLLKLGLKEIQDGDHKLVEDLFTVMQLKMADFTATFRQLAEVEPHQLLDKSVLETKWSLNKFSGEPTWEKWVQAYQERLKNENVSEDERRERMVRVNPLYVPRNWMMEEAIKDAENNDFEKVRFLLKLFQNPFEINEEAEKRGYSSQPPSWSYGLKLSCSS
ncbi:protein adenylyltransferase SelO [Helicoverpa armigera]|uniref:protein adenylyltransferase SelO n=1 Tax=Helicoverpa armigera TaxID=29058 RepID=UPI003082DD43